MIAYFDYAASAPPWPEAVAAQAAAAQRWFGNPSAAHRAGREAREELRRLKSQFAAACGFTDGCLVLTSGGTEANNAVIHGTLSAQPDARVLVAVDTHASAWNSCQQYPDRVDVLGLDPDGRITPAALAAALRPQTRLFCCSHAANETGVIQPVAMLAELCDRRQVRCLVDGTQALGHIPVDLAAIPCDAYTFSGHKFGGPRGIGGILLRQPALLPLMQGGDQEWQLRPGTENLPGLAGMTIALQASQSVLVAESARLRELSEHVLAALRQAGIAHCQNGDPSTGLPGLLSLSFPGLDGQALAADLDMQGFAVAYGSACHANRPEPSRVILALGRPPELARSTIRISLGRLTTAAEVDALAAALYRACGK